MRILVKHEALKLGAGGTTRMIEEKGHTISYEFLDAHNKAILSLRKDPEGMVIELDSDFAIVQEQ